MLRGGTGVCGFEPGMVSTQRRLFRYNFILGPLLLTLPVHPTPSTPKDAGSPKTGVAPRTTDSGLVASPLPRLYTSGSTDVVRPPRAPERAPSRRGKGPGPAPGRRVRQCPGSG